MDGLKVHSGPVFGQKDTQWASRRTNELAGTMVGLKVHSGPVVGQNRTGVGQKITEGHMSDKRFFFNFYLAIDWRLEILIIKPKLDFDMR